MTIPTKIFNYFHLSLMDFLFTKKGTEYHKNLNLNINEAPFTNLKYKPKSSLNGSVPKMLGAFPRLLVMRIR